MWVEEVQRRDEEAMHNVSGDQGGREENIAAGKHGSRENVSGAEHGGRLHKHAGSHVPFS